jgi:D-3-phosphoglycerate dehydrogenase
MLAYDPYVEELVMSQYGVEPAASSECCSSRTSSRCTRLDAERASHARGRALPAMKKTALFINTGRGPRCDEPALIKALQKAGSPAPASTCWRPSPRASTNPLLKMDNVILTAHVASASARFDPCGAAASAPRSRWALTGRWPRSCVNPGVLEKTSLRRWQPVSMERGPNS